MGYSRKEEIARLKRERREAKAAKKRQENVRERHVRFLIVCEGKKTEPLYFEALITNHTSTVREVTIEGEGRATVALVERTEEIRRDLERKNNMSFDRVWVVFDKDDFDDFNEAIKKARKLGFQSAWTNEAFELWYYLHFEYTALPDKAAIFSSAVRAVSERACCCLRWRLTFWAGKTFSRALPWSSWNRNGQSIPCCG